MSKKICLLYSGGLDSYIMYHIAKQETDDVVAIYYDHGQPVAEEEMKLLPDFVQVRRVDWMSEDNAPRAQPGRREGAVMIPGRNMAMAVLCACQELPDEIWIGALKGETHKKGTDKNFIFLEKMHELVNYVLGPFKADGIKFHYPLAERGLDKLGEVKWALANGLTKEQLMATRSCHDPRYHACGNCFQCIKRWSVFGECGFEEPYNESPIKSEVGVKFINDLINCELGRDDYYEPDTRAEMMPMLVQTYLNNPELLDPSTVELFGMLRDSGSKWFEIANETN